MARTIRPSEYPVFSFLRPADGGRTQKEAIEDILSAIPSLKGKIERWSSLYVGHHAIRIKTTNKRVTERVGRILYGRS
jgi:hypothetical protein